MIISRTPFRVSLVGGGTDLRSFYSVEPGRVLSTTIDKYLYVVVKRQVGIVEYKYRINWSKVEFRNSIDEIEHPIAREALRMFNIDFPIEISTFADVPANTGLGSSSAFAVGLVHALHAIKGEQVTKYQIASEAAQIEVDILGRTMGKQDHFASAYGGLNVFTFNSNETVSVEPVFYTADTWASIKDRVLLFYTGIKRDASGVLESQDKATEDKRDVLTGIRDLVFPLRDVIASGNNLHQIGEILHRGWRLKRSITSDVSSSQLDCWYDSAREAGAVGGKLLGAGKGGFLFFYAEPQRHEHIKAALPELVPLRIGFETGGTRITYYDQTIL